MRNVAKRISPRNGGGILMPAEFGDDYDDSRVQSSFDKTLERAIKGEATESEITIINNTLAKQGTSIYKIQKALPLNVLRQRLDSLNVLMDFTMELSDQDDLRQMGATKIIRILREALNEFESTMK